MHSTSTVLPRRTAFTGPPQRHDGPPLEVLALVAFHLRYGEAADERPGAGVNHPPVPETITRAPGDGGK
ncbi:hypothetical protein SAMN05421776_11784 [Nocardia farcinica]|uniref:Uncharacterized protein n=1 Tax=Nocardia farcinica TaxID=37329 RepID=A0A0H5PB87_NOCFR|nr:hypothetical protein [Nocardia farcinica]PFW99086.1 hypothetical protein CJ469_05692 [Nocardia farcinica]PFX06124.1 hypothetical protein CJ468_04990 [Nocardia farcinica]CRY79866.1 Uncharacterised protein [Nocardia farcinica]SIT33696.1 hypothetical protein SAMN05421776_11784 [Nocardia farcinica]